MNIAVLLVAGLAGLVVAAHFLVDGAARVGMRMRIPAVIIGLTLVAFGTSAPELAVSLRAAFAGSADIAAGNIVGSNVFNVLLILGTSALIMPLLVNPQLLRRDVPVMVAASLLFWLMAADGRVSTLEGCLLVALLIAYLAWLARSVQRGNKASVLDSEALELVQRPARALWKDLLALAGGVVGLVLAANWLVSGAVMLARQLGVSELVIGLTIVALGTSLPELATSVVAALKGERDIAIGNIVGSNTFNILSVLGLTALVVPGGLLIGPQMLVLDLPVMVAVAIMAVPLLAIRLQLTRSDGVVMLIALAAYLAVLILLARGTVFSPLQIVQICGSIGVLLVLSQCWKWWQLRRPSTGDAR